MRRLLVFATVLGSTLSGLAQIALPAAGATPFKDTSMLKPPAGSKVAIVEFEDLECPMCAQVSPLVWAAMEKYRVPRVHHDFLIQSHVWSRAAAIDARYLEDTVSPRVAEAFRRDVFAHQAQIAAPEDLQQFVGMWFRAHGVAMPFVMDGTGRCAEEVKADCLLGLRLGLRHTPTLLVVTDKQWIEVTDPRQLYAALDLAERSVQPAGGRSKAHN